MSHAAQPHGPPEPPPHELEWLAWLLLHSLPARFSAGQHKQEQGSRYQTAEEVKARRSWEPRQEVKRKDSKESRQGTACQSVCKNPQRDMG